MSKNIYNSISNKFSFINKDKKQFSTNKTNNFTKKEDSQVNEEVKNTEVSIEKDNYESLKKVIQQRRSVRKYTSHKPSYRLLLDIIQTATSTPRTGNIVPFHTTIIQDRSIISTISNLCYQQSWIAQAPYVLVVSSSMSEMYKFYPDMASRFSTQTTSSYITNILLLIQASGLSSCWIESMQEEILKDYLSVPRSHEIHAILPIGYAREINKAPSTPSFLSLVSFESYGNKENKN